jgi:hypothetical protein
LAGILEKRRAEAAWLVQEAAETIGDEKLVETEKNDP